MAACRVRHEEKELPTERDYRVQGRTRVEIEDARQDADAVAEMGNPGTQLEGGKEVAMMAEVDEKRGDVEARRSRRRGILGGRAFQLGGGETGEEFCDVLAGSGTERHGTGPRSPPSPPKMSRSCPCSGRWGLSGRVLGGRPRSQKGYVRN